MIRAIVLSIALLVGLGGTFVLTNDFAEAGAQKPRKQKKQKKAKYKKYSRQWWRAYRQKMRRNQSLAKRKRALRMRQIRLARSNRQENRNQVNRSNSANRNSATVSTNPAILPSGETAPQGWRQANVSNSELQYSVEDENGTPIGSASISLVGPAINTENNNGAATNNNPRNRTLGGMPTNSLRSSVIDRMVRENGWVVNDFQKEINGKKVYVVIAQSEGRGGVLQSRIFYFTEIDGKIFSLATTSSTTSMERLVKETEKVIESLTRSRPQQANR